jgi:hypothetical protein
MKCLKRIKRQVAVIGVVVSVLGAAISTQADQITTAPGFGPWQFGAGGEFTVTPDAAISALLSPSYSPFTVNQGNTRGSFQTFCIERNEYITAPTTFDVTLNNVTMFTGDPLSAGAAYLYQQFALGNLNYNYANASTFGGYGGASRNSGFLYSALYLQDAIWYLMNPNMFGGQANNPYVLAADAALGGAANTFLADNGAHGVKVLNLWSPGQPHDPQHTFQDVLIYTGNVPEPSVLALVSVAALFAARRRK